MWVDHRAHGSNSKNSLWVLIRSETLKPVLRREYPCPGLVRPCSWENTVSGGYKYCTVSTGKAFWPMNYYKVQWLHASLRVYLAQLHPAISCGRGIVVIGTPQITTSDTRNPSHSAHMLGACTWMNSTADGEQEHTACEAKVGARKPFKSWLVLFVISIFFMNTTWTCLQAGLRGRLFVWPAAPPPPPLTSKPCKLSANRMDDHHLFAPQQFYLLHVSCQITSHLWENGVTQQSMKLMVKSSDCSDTMRIKGDQNNHLNGNGLLLGAPHCPTKEMSARLCLLVIRKKKKKHNPQSADIFLLKTACLKNTDMLWKMDQICFMLDSSKGLSGVNLC